MTGTMLDQGLYDAAEVAWLLGHGVEWVVRWTTPSPNGSAIVSPTFERMFSFADLVSLRVALMVRQRGVSDKALRTGVRTLRERTSHARPLAVDAVIKQLATSGSSFLAELSGDYEDIGQGGQGVFQDVVQIYLTRIAFDAAGDPAYWIPADGVRMDPKVQAGAPCVVGTRIPTSTVRELLEDSEPEDVALDLDISVEAVSLAERFEEMLAQGAGLLV